VVSSHARLRLSEYWALCEAFYAAIPDRHVGGAAAHPRRLVDVGVCRKMIAKPYLVTCGKCASLRRLSGCRIAAVALVHGREFTRAQSNLCCSALLEVDRARAGANVPAGTRPEAVGDALLVGKLTGRLRLSRRPWASGYCSVLDALITVRRAIAGSGREGPRRKMLSASRRDWRSAFE